MFKLASLSPKEIFPADLQNERQHGLQPPCTGCLNRAAGVLFGQLFCKIRRKGKVIPFQHCLSQYFSVIKIESFPQQVLRGSPKETDFSFPV